MNKFIKSQYYGKNISITNHQIYLRKQHQKGRKIVFIKNRLKNVHLTVSEKKSLNLQLKIFRHERIKNDFVDLKITR